MIAGICQTGKFVRITKIFSGLILLCVFVTTQSFAETKIIRAARMVDVATGELISPASIVVDGNKIIAVNPEALPANAEIIDLGDRTVLPGLFDMHTHLTLDYFTGDNWTTAAVRETPADWALYGVLFGRQTLEAGFTTVRDAGTWPGFPDVALMRAIDCRMSLSTSENVSMLKCGRIPVSVAIASFNSDD